MWRRSFDDEQQPDNEFWSEDRYWRLRLYELFEIFVRVSLTSDDWWLPILFRVIN